MPCLSNEEKDVGIKDSWGAVYNTEKNCSDVLVDSRIVDCKIKLGGMQRRRKKLEQEI